MEDENLTVSQVNSYISKKMNRDAKLKNIYVKGELSNYKSYPHGHDYFTLKDEKSQIKGVMFKGRKRFLEFTPKDGIKVVIKGSVEVYEKNGYRLCTMWSDEFLNDKEESIRKINKIIESYD